MEINSKYRLETFPFELKVIEAFDFEFEPILLLEKDLIGNHFLSYLISTTQETEQRGYIQVSKERLNEVLAGEISIQNAFKYPENNCIFITDFFLSNGSVLNTYMVPATNEYEFIPEDYEFEFEYNLPELELADQELIDYSERKQKIIFDFYLKSQNLINNIKPYALYKVFTPVVEIIKSMLEIDARNVDEHIAFSNLRQASLGITIEVNYSKDLFMEKESIVMENLIELFNAQSKEDFEIIINKTNNNNNYIKHYKSIIKSIINNNSDLYTAYANPISKTVIESVIDKEKAQKAKEIIDETFDSIEDIENIKGTFLEIDIDRKEPSFKIFSFEDEFTVKGKLELSILEKIKNDRINLGKESYTFVIKTIYQPETTLKAKKIKRFLIDYIKET